MKTRVLPVVALLCLVAASAEAQTPIISGAGVSSPVSPFREYATRELHDPWDMNQRTDIGWFTWGADQPAPKMSNLAMAIDSLGNTYFSGHVATNPADPSFFLLDTWGPGSALLGKVGVNHPIDTTVYNYLIVKMKLEKSVFPSQFATVGVPQFQLYWSTNTIFYDASARPNGGTLTTVAADGSQRGLTLLREGVEPFNSVEGGKWVIYRIPMTIPEIQAFSSTTARWGNVAGGTDSQWGAAGVTGDSLRFKPINLVDSVIGEIQVDWARLVSYSTASQTTVTWTGGGTRDIVVSTQTDCSDFAVVAYSQSSGYQFPSQMLPPGTYRIGLRSPFTKNGQTGTGAVTCSTSTLTVQTLPTMTLTSPNPEGSADDFATTFLGNAWDMDALTDIDVPENLTLPDATYGIVTKSATDPEGSDLGSLRVYRAKSNAGSAASGFVGDPHIYMLWPAKGNGARARGLNNRIDANRYRILTTEVSVERTRDLLLGSIARIVWHVAGDTDGTGAMAANVSQDIALRHLDPATENGGKIVLETIQADMADRASLPLETDPGGTPSTTGWSNTCTVPVGCAASAAQNPGIDMIRLDPHEFNTQIDFDVRRIKLAALERTGSTFNIQWTSSNPSGVTALVTLRALPYRNAAAKDLRPLNTSCTGGFTIATGLSLASNSYTWTPASTVGLTNGGEYFVCAEISVGGITAETVTAKWPVAVDTTFTGLKPTLRMDRTTLRFAGVHTGQQSPVFSSKSPAETVRIVQQGSGTVNWTLTAADPNGNPVDWLSISQTSGTGGAIVTIGLVDSVNLPSCSVVDGLGAAIKLTSAQAGDTPQYIQVYLTIHPGSTAFPGSGCPFTRGVTNPAFGQVDTPVQNATGVVGAIGVTGWVLDDIGVASLKIYRNCLAFESVASPSPCQTVGGNLVVFVGDAAFLAGARTDVEAAFETFPYAYRAGWGFLMLTPMLPHVPNQQPYGGQGTLTLYIYATDQEGQQTLLGRNQLDSTPTSITMSNDTIAKPFGAIDTPGQGETVSGTLNNFGWALTPDSNTTAETGDILIPTNGSTSFVFIDGLPVAAVRYNNCRGTVGNPVPAGVFCNDDVSNIFGNPTPQPSLATRTANVTRHRNLDAGRGPIGLHQIDTTALSNGLHTIAWSVTDSAGRTEGIGSRFFNVVNGSSARAATALALADAPARAVVDAAGIAAVLAERPAEVEIYGRVGFGLDAPWQTIQPHVNGGRQVTIPELGRLELWVGQAVQTGYLQANGTLRALPPGSLLKDGRFTWAPGAGYLGHYELLFSGGIGQVPVRVTIVPKPSDGPAIRAHIDAPQNRQRVDSAFMIGGWATDRYAVQDSGIGAVHVWAFSRGSVGAAPFTFLGAATLGGERPDVAEVEGEQFLDSGWGLVAAPLPPGNYEIVAYFWSTRTGRFEDAKSVNVTVR